jgi:rhamnogalacturonyl hydrolase YesR
MTLFLRRVPNLYGKSRTQSFEVHNGLVVIGSISTSEEDSQPTWRWYLHIGFHVGLNRAGEASSKEEAMQRLATYFRGLCAEHGWSEGSDFHDTSLAFP